MIFNQYAYYLHDYYTTKNSCIWALKIQCKINPLSLPVVRVLLYLVRVLLDLF